MLVQVAGALSALESLAGAVRVTRFDHSALDNYDSSGVGTDLFMMEYLVHFHGLARPADLPLLTALVDAGDCGEMAAKMLCDVTLDCAVFHRHYGSG